MTSGRARKSNPPEEENQEAKSSADESHNNQEPAARPSNFFDIQTSLSPTQSEKLPAVIAQINSFFDHSNSSCITIQATGKKGGINYQSLLKVTLEPQAQGTQTRAIINLLGIPVGLLHEQKNNENKNIARPQEPSHPQLNASDNQGRSNPGHSADSNPTPDSPRPLTSRR